MVILDFLFIIRRITYFIVIVLFASVLFYFFVSLGLLFITFIYRRFNENTKRKILDTLYDYMLEEFPVRNIRFKKRQRKTIIMGFAAIISLIKGQRQEHMKEAVRALGLIIFLEKWLASISPSRRMRACHLLGLMQSKQSSASISKLLFDSNPKVVSAAIIALGEINDHATVASLLRLFSACPFSHAWLIAAILPSFGSRVYEHIKPYLLNGKLPPERLTLLIKALSEFRLSKSFQVMREIYKTHFDLDVRLNALTNIGKMYELQAVTTVFDALRAEEWQLRAVACRIMGEMSLKGSHYRLIPLITDRNFFVRKNAAKALVRMGKIGVMTLLSCLELDDRYARDMVAQTLEANGIVERAVRNLSSRDEKEKNFSSDIIEALIHKGYVNYLDNFKQENEEIREMIAEYAYL